MNHFKWKAAYPLVFQDEENVYGCMECKYPICSEKNVENLINFYFKGNPRVGVLINLNCLYTRIVWEKRISTCSRRINCFNCNTILNFQRRESTTFLKSIKEQVGDECQYNCGRGILNLNKLVLLPAKELHDAYIKCQ